MRVKGQTPLYRFVVAYNKSTAQATLTFDLDSDL